MPMLGQNEPILKPGAADSFYYAGFGTGSDSAVVFDGSSVVLGLSPSSSVYTLTRDIFPTDMTINAGVTVACQGFVPYVKGRLKLVDSTSKLIFKANDGSGLTAGASFSTVGTLNVTAAAGGNGRNTTGAGSNGSGAGSNNVTGTGSGAGGTAGGANTGGTGNTTVAPTAAQGSIQEFGAMIRKRLQGANSFNGSGGGGGGGCDVTVGTATSGGGGSSCGTLMVWCRELENNGVIAADGGNGANATTAGGGIAGGGGGGSAGTVMVIAGKVLIEGTIRAAAGQGGTSTNGASGANGLASGNVVKFYGNQA